MQFDLVSPERKLASLSVSEVDLPGAEGDFTAMPQHAPVLTTLRPGVVTAKSGSDSTVYVVSGGFVEVNAESVSVLAEWAVPMGDATGAQIEALVAEAEAAAGRADGPEKDLADLRVAQTKALLQTVSGTA
ncbi:MAG: ATP synthase F1 subunit epsilon [Pseudomonadota bacterium]